MSFSGFVKSWLPALIVLIWVALQGTSVLTQQRAGTPLTDKVQPVNS